MLNQRVKPQDKIKQIIILCADERCENPFQVILESHGMEKRFRAASYKLLKAISKDSGVNENDFRAAASKALPQLCAVLSKTKNGILIERLEAFYDDARADGVKIHKSENESVLATATKGLMAAVF